MNIFENIPIDFNLLILIMPGFFFLKFFGIKKRSNFEYTILSLFWGILLMVFYYYVFPTERLVSLVQNPYAGAVVFSISAVLLAFLIRLFIEFIKRALNPRW
jgi:hypothetical protein